MEDPDVQAGVPEYIKSIDPNNAHPSWHTADVKQNIYNYLMAKDLDPEMSSSQYKNFMIWHRGLAVPAARNTTTDRFKQGMKLFKEIGCANCHRPSWTTGDDNIQDPNGIFTNSDMPRYPHQKIWPYTDFVQHRLFMENDIRTGWCRTTPLWGRGLSKLCTGAEDRLHDCRARNTMEAIMWHGNAKSDARFAIEKFPIVSTLSLNNGKQKKTRLVNSVLTWVMLIHTTLLLALRWFVSDHLPMSNGYETMQFMAWATLIVTLVMQKRFLPVKQFGPLLSSFALLVAMITDGNPQITQLMPVLQSPLLSVHVMVIMFSYALFGLTALIGLQGLIAHHRKQEEKEQQLAALSQFLLYPAVALIAIGIFIGAIWANVSWGRYWSWDSKETWALITMLIYSAPLHADIKWLRKAQHMHIYMLLAFLSVLMTYFGVNYFLSGMHSYA